MEIQVMKRHAGGPPRKELTDDQIEQLRYLSGIRLPMDHIAPLFKMSRECLEDNITRNPKAKAAVEEGRAKASINVRRTLYLLAVGEKDEHTGRWITPPDFQALRFWCSAMEGFTTKVVMTDNDGNKIGVIASMTEQERQAEIDRLLKIREVTSDVATIEHDGTRRETDHDASG